MSALPQTDLAPTIGGATPVSPASEQAPPARVVAFPKTDPRAGNQLAAGQSMSEAHVVGACGEAFDLNARIRAVLAELGDIEPATAASVIMDDLNDAQRDAVATSLIAARVRSLKHNGKREVRRIRSERWDAVAQAGDSLDIFREAVRVGDAMKPLGECSRADIGLVVEGARLRARVFARRARAFELLGEEMGRRGVERVGELPVEIVKRVLS